MNRRYPLVTSGAFAVALAWLVAGCGDYADPAPGSGGSAGTTGVAGSTAGTNSAGGSTSGSGGSTAGTNSAGGSTSGSGGSTAGTAGSTSGTGGSTAGTGGSAAGSGGDAAGTGGSGAGTGGTGGSGAGGPVTCDELAACGGAVVGTYTVVSCPLEMTGNVDVRGLGLQLSCEMAESPVSGTLEVAGTFTLNEDGTYEDETTTTGEVTFELVEECLVLSGTTTTCGMISGPIASVGFRTLACVDNAETGGCSCTGTVEQDGGLGFVDVNAETRGTYTTMDSALVTSAFGNDTEYSYCTADNKLAMTVVTVSKTGGVMGQIILQKN